MKSQKISVLPPPNPKKANPPEYFKKEINWKNTYDPNRCII